MALGYIETGHHESDEVFGFRKDLRDEFSDVNLPELEAALIAS